MKIGARRRSQTGIQGWAVVFICSCRNVVVTKVSNVSAWAFRQGDVTLVYC